MSRLALFVSTVAYVGFFPIAPGTAGSLAALVPYAAVVWMGMPVVEALLIVAVLLVGVWAATRSEALLGGKDPGPVVIDEVLGMLVTLAFLPLSAAGIVLGFVLFRIYDVIKPYPAGRLEHAPGGWGVMLDDLMAGLYAHVTLRLVAWAAPAWVLT